MLVDTTVADYLESLVQDFFDELTARPVLGIESPDEMEALYALGYYQFTFGMYEAARNLFGQLAREALAEPHHWRALGAVCQHMGDYREAVAAYDAAIAADPTDIISRTFRAECHLLSGDIEEGLAGLSTAVSIGAGVPELAVWSSRAALLLQLNQT